MNKPKPDTYISILILVVVLVGMSWIAGRSDSDTPPDHVLFSSDTKDLPEAVPMPTVELKDGDTYEMEAQIIKKEINGQEVKMLGYNGSVPGPYIKVQQGSTIAVVLTNNTDIETTLHSHGVRVDNKFDGVPGFTQDPIPVGGSFTYQLTFPDAGIYWYHPHIREDYAQELGLYGNFLVEPQDTAFWSPVNQTIPLVLDDILIEDGQIASFAKDEGTHTLMGRFGNVMLVNGDTNVNLAAKTGEVVRLLITNTANTRTFKFSIPGVRMKLVGSDGGVYEQEEFVNSIIVSPSERAVVDVLFSSAGTYPIHHITPRKTYSLGTVTVESDVALPSYVTDFEIAAANEYIRPEMTALRPLLAKAIDKRVRLDIDMDMEAMMGGDHGEHMIFNTLFGGNVLAQAGHEGHGMPAGSAMGGHGMGGSAPIEWEDDMAAMNALSSSHSVEWKIIDEATGKTNMDINWTFKQGEIVKLRISNDATSMHPMQHPIHLHGQRFLVASTNGVPNDNLVWKDTALIQAGDEVELLIEMSNIGEWMLHCHIAEHLEGGMMLAFTVTS